MQKYAHIYSLQNYSTCFGCHSTHHQEYQKLYPQLPLRVILLVPEAAGTVFNTRDVGCCDTRNMQSTFAVNENLHTVASVGFLFALNYDAGKHEHKIQCSSVRYPHPVKLKNSMLVSSLPTSSETEKFNANQFATHIQ